MRFVVKPTKKRSRTKDQHGGFVEVTAPNSFGRSVKSADELSQETDLGGSVASRLVRMGTLASLPRNCHEWICGPAHCCTVDHKQCLLSPIVYVSRH